ncbi:protein transport protein SEC20, partial [Tremellales sp. Uapishka_1]
MPPLPPATLASIQSLLASVERQTHDIASYQLPRLSTTTSLALHRELAEEVRTDLDAVAHSLEVCAELRESLRSSEREGIDDRCGLLAEDYTRLKKLYRETMLSSKREITRRSVKKHELLDGGGGVELKTTEAVEMGGEDELQAKTNQVTEAMLRTAETMQKELERSVLSTQILNPDESTKTLQSTANLYDSYASLLTTSRHLIKHLEKADWYDRLLILFALLFFVLVVGYILKRRVLDKLVGGVGWWVFGTGKLVRMGLGLGKKEVRGDLGVGTGEMDGIKLRKGLAMGKEGKMVEKVLGQDIVPVVEVGDSAVKSLGAGGGETSSGGEVDLVGTEQGSTQTVGIEAVKVEPVERDRETVEKSIVKEEPADNLFSRIKAEPIEQGDGRRRDEL